VAEGAVQRLAHGMRLSPDSHGPAQVFVTESLQGIRKNLPSAVPFPHELLACHPPLGKLGLPVPPGLLPVARQEISETRGQIAGNMPHQGGHGIAFTRRGLGQLRLAELFEGAFTHGLVAPVFTFDGCHHLSHLFLLDSHRNNVYASVRTSKRWLRGVQYEEKEAESFGPFLFYPEGTSDRTAVSIKDPAMFCSLTGMNQRAMMKNTPRRRT